MRKPLGCQLVVGRHKFGVGERIEAYRYRLGWRNNVSTRSDQINGEESEVRTKDPSDSTGTFTPRFVLLAARSSLVPRVIRIVSVRNPAPRIAGNSQEAIPIARVTIRILQPLTRAALIAHR
jgi:hypothetical protein